MLFQFSELLSGISCLDASGLFCFIWWLMANITEHLYTPWSAVFLLFWTAVIQITIIRSQFRYVIWYQWSLIMIIGFFEGFISKFILANLYLKIENWYFDSQKEKCKNKQENNLSCLNASKRTLLKKKCPLCWLTRL